MNREQKLLVAKAKRHLAKLKRRERVYRRLCEDPDLQHDWDNWMHAAGYANGFAAGLGQLLAYIEAEKAAKPKAPK